MTVQKQCPFCNNITSVEVDDEQYDAFCKGLDIIAALPDLNAFQRETIKTGMCPSCQEKTFHIPLPEHKDKWGERLGECLCCGQGLYEKIDKTEDGKYQCSLCGESYTREEIMETET